MKKKHAGRTATHSKSIVRVLRVRADPLCTDRKHAV